MEFTLQTSETVKAESPGGSSFWLLCLVCVIILFWRLGSAALFEPDEGRNAEKAREILLLGDWVTPHENFLPTLDKPIFFYWLVAISFKLFGLSEGSARLPSALAGLGCIVLLYRFARDQWGTQEALWSALILATSLEFVLLARFVIFDMTLTFFITLSLFSFYAAAHSDNLRCGKLHGLVMYAAMAVGTLIKGPIAAVVPGIVIFFYLLLSLKWFLLQRLNIALGTLLYFVIVAPWYAWAETRNPGYLRYFLWEEHFLRYVTPHFGRSKGGYYYFLVLGAGFLPWTFLIPLVARSVWKRKLTDLDLFLVLWVVLPFAFFSASNSKLPHYILPIYPALALLTGKALLDDKASERRILWIPNIFIVAFIGYLLVGALRPHLLAKEIRTEVVQNFAPLVVYGAAVAVIFGIYVVGDRKNFWRGRDAAFVSTATALTLFILLTVQLMSASTERSAKSIAQAIAPLLRAEDRLVFYDVSMEGLPFYLRLIQPIWLVHSQQKKELMGSIYVAERRPIPARGYGQVLFGYEQFAAEWKKNAQPLRVFLKQKDLPRLRKEIDEAPKSIITLNDIVVVSNR